MSSINSALLLRLIRRINPAILKLSPDGTSLETSLVYTCLHTYISIANRIQAVLIFYLVPIAKLFD